MARRCEHKWKVVSSFYDKPNLSHVKVSNVSEEFLDRLYLGTTTVSLVCESCGEPNTRLLAGKWENPTQEEFIEEPFLG